MYMNAIAETSTIFTLFLICLYQTVITSCNYKIPELPGEYMLGYQKLD